MSFKAKDVFMAPLPTFVLTPSSSSGSRSGSDKKYSRSRSNSNDFDLLPFAKNKKASNDKSKKNKSSSKGKKSSSKGKKSNSYSNGELEFKLLPIEKKKHSSKRGSSESEELDFDLLPTPIKRNSGPKKKSSSGKKKSSKGSSKRKSSSLDLDLELVPTPSGKRKSSSSSLDLELLPTPAKKRKSSSSESLDFNLSGAPSKAPKVNRPVLKKKAEERLQSEEIIDAIQSQTSDPKYNDFVVFGTTLAAGWVPPTLKRFVQKNVKSNKTKFAFVFNTQSSEKKGEHWTAMFVKWTPSRNRIVFEYFDSFGRGYRGNSLLRKQIQEIQKIFNDALGVANIDEKIHAAERQKGSVQCGVFVSWFIIQKAKGKSFNSIEQTEIDDNACIRLRNVYWNPTN